jgi:hypothetical protein
MILTKTQAEHVMQVMAVMNNVGARVAVRFMDATPAADRATMINAFEARDGTIEIERLLPSSEYAMEEYKDQNDFAKAYGLE